MEVIFMTNIINESFRGATVTLALTGLPVTIKGEVLGTPRDGVIVLRLENGNKVYINAELVAFVF
jgi:hypothetical protein